MRFSLLILCLLISSCTCNEKTDSKPIQLEDTLTEIPFDKEKWSFKKDQSYPYREKMLNNVIFNDALRKLKRTELIEQLGEPTKVNNEYVYYLIEKNSLLFVTLNASTLVIKFKEDDTVDWMKIHE